MVIARPVRVQGRDHAGSGRREVPGPGLFVVMRRREGSRVPNGFLKPGRLIQRGSLSGDLDLHVPVDLKNYSILADIIGKFCGILSRTCRREY